MGNTNNANRDNPNPAALRNGLINRIISNLMVPFFEFPAMSRSVTLRALGFTSNKLVMGVQKLKFQPPTSDVRQTLINIRIAYTT